MKFHLLTIFPDFFDGPFRQGVVARAAQAGALDIHIHDLRTWTHDLHRTVDDRPFGGGEGMLLKTPAHLRTRSNPSGPNVAASARDSAFRAGPAIHAASRA